MRAELTSAAGVRDATAPAATTARTPERVDLLREQIRGERGSPVTACSRAMESVNEGTKLPQQPTNSEPDRESTKALMAMKAPAAQASENDPSDAA